MTLTSMTATRSIRAALQRSVCLIAVVVAACGGGGAQRPSATLGKAGSTTSKRVIAPSAARDFDAAMRALRLHGPEATETARARLQAAVKADPSLWEAWFNLGAIAWRHGDDDEAVSAFTRALDIHKDHGASLMARAEAYRRSGRKAQARADYEAALHGMAQDDPNRTDTAVRLASLLRDDRAFDDAVGVLRDAARAGGIHAKIYIELGYIYLAQERFELAQLVLAKALQLDAKDPTVYNALALLAARQGKAQESFQLFDQAASLDRSYIDARFNKAAVLLDAGDYGRAKTELTAIVESRGDDYAAQVALGVAQRGLREFADAQKTWERVVGNAGKRSTARADALWNLATLKLDFTEDAAGGKADLERYLQEAPSGHGRRQDAENKCKEVTCK